MSSATYAYLPEIATLYALPLVSYVPVSVGDAGFEMFMTWRPEVTSPTYAYLPKTATPYAVPAVS